MTARIKIILVNVAVIASLCLLIFVLATWWRMQAQFSLGEAAFRRGDFAAAVAGYESAIHMYIPLHPTINKSAQRLWKIGEINERQGDVNRALISYRALRSSFYAAAWLVIPGQDWIARCDTKIAALVPYQRER